MVVFWQNDVWYSHIRTDNAQCESSPVKGGYRPMYNDLKGQTCAHHRWCQWNRVCNCPAFVNEGCRVVILDNDPSALIKWPGLNCHSGRRDSVQMCSNPDDSRGGIQGQMDEIMGGIDILISNAGISLRKPFTEVDYTQWSKIMRVNLDGMFFCAGQPLSAWNRSNPG